MGMELKMGRNFSPIRELDSTHVIINEIAIKIFGLSDNPIGEELTINNNK
jgi:hypothetical protein